jgi:ankyrin repeat protein
MKKWIWVIGWMTAAWAGDTSAARIQDAAAKAVRVIQKSQQNWYRKQGCTSCHQQVFPALAFRAAREHGIALDEAAAHADAAAAFGYFSDFARAVEYTHVIDPALSDGYAMLAADAAGVRPSLVMAVYARLVAARQEADGHWETMDERPPQSYSPFTATAVALRAIQLYAHASRKAEIEERSARARSWLLSHQPRATEERAYRLLGAHWAGASAAELDELAGELRAAQRSDGGWNSRDGLASDAYSTGEALVALHDGGGVPVADAAWRRGIQYLLDSQAPEGSWHVVSRLHPPAPVSPPYFETGHPYGHDQFISTMGECLAVMALAAALGPGKPQAPRLKEAEPAAIEPWAETLLFGSTEEVKKLLADGFDPNSRSQAGGLTALMLAAPDTAKMKLLIERGAGADARAKDRFSALLVAAQYPDATAAMNLLLDHGATVRLPKGQGAPPFNAFATYLAANSGNAAILGRLHQSGDRLDDQMILLGMFPQTPLMGLSTTQRTDSARALLDLGAPVDETDSDGITPLGWCAIANRVEMARLLIARGADVNHVDSKGMTPLLYAASIDFGDSTMIELLLKSGARPDARTREGLTAAGLARKYKHTNLLASLEATQAVR